MVVSSLSTAVGAQVRLRREQRGLSAAELARRAGLSKATLSGIESGRANPTIDTLDAVALSLGIPLSDLLAREQNEQSVLIRTTETGDAVTHELLRRVSGGHQLEIWRLRIAAGGTHEGVPHAPGTVEHLLVSQGTLMAGHLDDQHQLHAGDLLAFAGDRPHRYASDTGADVCVIIASPLSTTLS